LAGESYPQSPFPAYFCKDFNRKGTFGKRKNKHSLCVLSTHRLYPYLSIKVLREGRGEGTFAKVPSPPFTEFALGKLG